MELLLIMALSLLLIDLFLFFLMFYCKSPKNLITTTADLTNVQKLGRNRYYRDKFHYGGIAPGHHCKYTYSFTAKDKTYKIHGECSTQYTHLFKKAAVTYPKGFPRLALLSENSEDFAGLYKLLALPSCGLALFLLLIYISYI